jgi:RNA polymerase sigma factor (TIGR02999 family)
MNPSDNPNLGRLETTQLLARCNGGEQEALDEVFRRVYAELRAIAHRARRGAADTLGTTGLIHETWLKFQGAANLSLTDRQHFCRTAARAMRQILINAAEARLAAKRGGDAPHASLVDEIVGQSADPQQIIDVGQAIERLHEMDPRAAEVVELRYFGGYSSEECAEILAISTPTVQRDWRLARAWLSRELGGGAPVE